MLGRILLVALLGLAGAAASDERRLLSARSVERSHGRRLDFNQLKAKCTEVKTNIGRVKTDVDDMRVFTSAYKDTYGDMQSCKKCLTTMKTSAEGLHTSATALSPLPYIGFAAKACARALTVFKKVLASQIKVVDKVEAALKKGKAQVTRVDGQLKRAQDALKKAQAAGDLYMSRAQKIDTVTRTMAPAIQTIDKGTVRNSAVGVAKTAADVCTAAAKTTNTDIKACNCARGSVQYIKGKVELARTGIETYKKIVCSTVYDIVKKLYDVFRPFINLLNKRICIPGFRRRLTTMEEHFAMIEDPERNLHLPDHEQPRQALLSRRLLARGDRRLGFTKWVSDAGKSVAGGVSSAAKSVGNTVSSGVKAVGDGLSSAAKAIASLPASVAGLFDGSGCFTIKDVIDKTLGAVQSLVDKAIEGAFKALGISPPSIPGLNIDVWGVPIGWVDGMEKFDFDALKPETLFDGMPTQLQSDLSNDQVWTAFNGRRQLLLEAPAAPAARPKTTSWIEHAKRIYLNRRRLAATDNCFGGSEARKLASGASAVAPAALTALLALAMAALFGR